MRCHAAAVVFVMDHILPTFTW